jgi:hypothetical protein
LKTYAIIHFSIRSMHALSSDHSRELAHGVAVKGTSATCFNGEIGAVQAGGEIFALWSVAGPFSNVFTSTF